MDDADDNPDRGNLFDREARIMKKELVIEMEEECITCPKLSLETHTLYEYNNSAFKVHRCEHIDFCQEVRKNWEKYHKVERKEE